LHEGLEPWLCHDCGDCSTTCPQQAEPRESMAILQRYLTAQYDITGLSSKIYQSKVWAIGSLLFVGFLVLFLVVLYHSFVVGMPLSDFTSTPMGMEHMFDTITYFTLAVIFIPIFILASHAYQMYRFTMNRGVVGKIPPSLYLNEFKTMILNAFAHVQIRKCPEKVFKIRWIKHWFLALGCALIFAILVFFLRWFQTDNIYPLYHPQRWLGYICTAFITFGSVDVLIARIKKKRETRKFFDFSDVSLPILLLLTAVSGIAVHIFRYSGLRLASHYAYIFHLVVAVPMLIIELPFGRWSHMIFRPLAIYFQSVKEKAIYQQVDEELEAA
jgi:hypothetical protein